MAHTKTNKVKKICPQLTTSQKTARHEKFAALTDDVNNAHVTYMDEVQNLSKKHGRSEHWTHRQLFLGGQTVCQCRRPNAWNAFVCQRLNDINEGLAKGDRWKLTEFIESHKETLRHDYARLPHTQKNAYEVEIMKIRAAKQCMVCNNPKAVLRDMQAMFAAMDQEWTAICSRLEKAKKFVQSILDLEPQCLALELEAFTVSGLAEDVPATSNQKKSLNKLVSECWTQIQDELDYILRENKISDHMQMNYTNYEHVLLNITVQFLLNALIEGTCHWTKLSEEELADRITRNQAREAAGEAIYKPRKMRTKKAIEKSAAIVESSDEGDGSDESNRGDESNGGDEGDENNEQAVG
ncbi:hypothetical protein EDB19DRAFT_1907369 [Suillus lakei]|nr:hypothetical protein EDB19DRAFT_1907369 [Suillus lakei]